MVENPLLAPNLFQTERNLCKAAILHNRQLSPVPRGVRIGSSARTRADCDQFSDMPADPETEVWGKVDLNRQPLFPSFRRQLIVQSIVCELIFRIVPVHAAPTAF